jgi:hypothetical protein
MWQLASLRPVPSRQAALRSQLFKFAARRFPGFLILWTATNIGFLVTTFTQRTHWMQARCGAHPLWTLWRGEKSSAPAGNRCTVTTVRDRLTRRNPQLNAFGATLQVDKYRKLIPIPRRAWEVLQLLFGSDAQLYTMHNKQQIIRWKGFTA